MQYKSLFGACVAVLSMALIGAYCMIRLYTPMSFLPPCPFVEAAPDYIGDCTTIKLAHIVAQWCPNRAILYVMNTRDGHAPLKFGRNDVPSRQVEHSRLAASRQVPTLLRPH